MLSRLSTRAGPLTRAVLRSENVCVAVARTDMTSAKKLPTAEYLKNWEEADKLYHSEERDLVNFPDPVMRDDPPPLRCCGVVPETWFQYFFEKTGATGPYMFAAAVMTTLLSKEILVIDHNFVEVPVFLAVLYTIGKKFGTRMKNYFDKVGEEYTQNTYLLPMEEAKVKAAAIIADGEEAKEQVKAQKHIYEAFRENVDLQLEEAYRQRLGQVHAAVTKRLDYQAAVETTKRRFEHEHMTQWIIDNAVKGITPQQEKESISKCISDLKTLAARA